MFSGMRGVSVSPVFSTIREWAAILSAGGGRAPPDRALQTRQGLRIGLTAKVLLQARGKDRFPRRRMSKERHRRMEFQVVWMAEDFVDRTSLNAREQRRALAQPLAQHGMRKLGGGFGERRQRERLRGHAVPEPRDLRKDEPHPVTALTASPQLTHRRLVYGPPRIDKPLQSKATVHRQRRILRSATRHGRQDLDDARRAEIGVLF